VGLIVCVYIGKLPSANKKSKLVEQMIEEVKEGETDKEKLFGKYGSTYMRMYKAVDHCMNLVKKPKIYERTEIPDNGIWFGKAGSGKTWDAEQKAIDQGMSLFKMPIAQMRKGWYDGYAGEEIILFDDFRGGSMEPHEFLNLLDGLARLPIKGGHVENKAKVLMFTSPDHPINWWPKWYAKDDNNWAQVKRRLRKIFYCENYNITETDIEEYKIYQNVVETVKIGF